MNELKFIRNVLKYKKSLIKNIREMNQKYKKSERNKKELNLYIIRYITA